MTHISSYLVQIIASLELSLQFLQQIFALILKTRISPKLIFSMREPQMRVIAAHGVDHRSSFGDESYFHSMLEANELISTYCPVRVNLVTAS